MFDSMVLPEVSTVTAATDAGLIDTISTAARLESAVMARRLAAIAELFNRRLNSVQVGEREQWLIDGHAEVTAEVAAALGITRARAEGLIRSATTLHERLPKVAAVFAAGTVDYRVIAAIVARTNLIIDDADVAVIDTKLAPRLRKYNRLSEKKLTAAIDQLVVTVDVLAKKPARDRDEDRGIEVDPDCHGMAEMRGILRATDALAFIARLDALAATVCRHDPRTAMQRRADAVGPLSDQQSALGCLCGREDCAAPTTEASSTSLAIHVFTQSNTAPAQTSTTGTETTGATGASTETTPNPAPPSPKRSSKRSALLVGEHPGYLSGYGFLTPDAVAALAATARLIPVIHPGDSPPETSYRPSTALADFVRSRDLSCRFPGCDTPAQACDIDHTVPWPAGPTHASNLKLLCRPHHLLKSFWNGQHWWTDRQYPDGTVEWTAPTGHTYNTTPHGALFFPQLATPTGTLSLPTHRPPPTPGRGTHMPQRQRTRTQTRQDRIHYQRGLNAAILAGLPPPEPQGEPPF